MEEGIAVCRRILEQHNQAMLDSDEKGAAAIRKEASRLATRRADTGGSNGAQRGAPRTSARSILPNSNETLRATASSVSAS
jgi:hypothetical protein